MKASKITLKDVIAYQQNAIVSTEIIKKPTGRVVVFAFDAGEELTEHTAPFDAMVTVLDGKAIITIGGEPHPLIAGEAIVMPAHIPHAVSADGRFKMMLTMIRETPKT